MGSGALHKVLGDGSLRSTRLCARRPGPCSRGERRKHAHTETQVHIYVPQRQRGRDRQTQGETERPESLCSSFWSRPQPPWSRGPSHPPCTDWSRQSPPCPRFKVRTQAPPVSLLQEIQWWVGLGVHGWTDGGVGLLRRSSLGKHKPPPVASARVHPSVSVPGHGHSGPSSAARRQPRHRRVWGLVTCGSSHTLSLRSGRLQGLSARLSGVCEVPPLVSGLRPEV